MAVVPQLRDPRLEEALVYTLHNDPNQVVRLKAMTALEQQTFDSTVKDALLITLKNDPAVQLRLKALEALSSQAVEADAIWQAIRSSDQEGNPAVVQYAAEHVKGL
ncbi:MAG: hypothetical protein KJ970_05835 [Candidatus Eisenbacteria bacterium]|uniref:HEAT repeat domain-containing protein n=1 Tax=Eiseniibacteriota bacterium TaxID=2212470 RepID=A0A948W5V4_UNCEI|nr:hypothetical protein [Candidatus Eisenbacteria bacterium]MBU1949357.1 hypothetical protein [Candidatus Eisenbacteria bacterium]MBU2690430.1 hypothetical protein [Candidatus Eisenbacteria bacterium]